MTETIVGYATIDAMFKDCLAGIEIATIDGKYIGNKLEPYRAYIMREYLKNGGTKDETRYMG